MVMKAPRVGAERVTGERPTVWAMMCATGLCGNWSLEMLKMRPKVIHRGSDHRSKVQHPDSGRQELCRE